MNNGYEIAIERTGWGPCHYAVIGLCGLCSLAGAGASFIIFVVAPLIACDLHFTRSEATNLNATSSLGMALGAFFFGTLSDINGRKGSIPATMIITFCAGIGLCFSHTRFLINTSIFLLGLGLAGNDTVVRVYLIECLPMKKRGSRMVLLDLLWIIGYLSALGISWSLMPSIVRMLGKQFRPSSWRVLAGISCAPSLMTACAVSLLPASPRYLIYHRRPEQAHSVLQEIYAINNTKHVDAYRSNGLESAIRAEEDEDDRINGCMKGLRRYIARVWKKFGIIRKTPFKRKTIAGLIGCLLYAPGFVWLALWVAALEHDETKNMNGSDVRAGNATCAVDFEKIALGFLQDCYEIENSRFRLLLLVSLSYVLGEALLASGIDTIGRRPFLLLSGLIGGSTFLGFFMTTEYVARIILSILLLVAYAIGFTTTKILILENYPTGVRGTAAGFTKVFPHLAAFFAKMFLSVPCLHSTLAISGMLMGAALVSTTLPDLTGAPMLE